VKGSLTSFVRFALTGALNTGFGYATYAALVLIGLPLWLAVGAATLLAIVFNFYSYGGLVFGKTSRRYLPAFLGVYSALGIVNFLGLKSLTQAGVGPLVSQALLVPLLAITGYVGMRMLVFRDKRGV
jgi:putative flippase GtrA